MSATMTNDEKFTADGVFYPRKLRSMARTPHLDDADRVVLQGAALWIEAARAMIAAADETIDGVPFDDLVTHALRERGELPPITPEQVERFEDDLEKSGAEFWAERWGEKDGAE